MTEEALEILCAHVPYFCRPGHILIIIFYILFCLISRFKKCILLNLQLSQTWSFVKKFFKL